MIEKKVLKLSDTELEEICGGSFADEYEKGFASEAGKQTLLMIAAPLVIGVSTAVGTFIKWICERCTKKLDKVLDK